MLDVNNLRLIASPSLSASTQQQAYPVLFYATFWYPHIPESNFGGSHRTAELLGFCNLHPESVSVLPERLPVPALCGMFVAFSKGVEVFRSNWRAMAALMFDMRTLAVVFLIYFLMEYSLIVLRDWFPGFTNLIKPL